MDSALLIHRLQFAFTVTYHYLFPQLTMGLAPLIVILKTLAIRTNDETYDKAARFWAKIFGINFAIGVVTGIPMEFQFGTNWSHFSRFAGGVIGQTLAMEGLFAFFLESTFLGLFLYGEKRLSKTMHWFAAFMVFVGSWASGFFIVATDAWMQNPVGYEKSADGSLQLASFWALVLNPWAWLQYAHTMSGAVITGCIRDGRSWRTLPAQQPACGAGAHICSSGRDCWLDLHRLADVPDWRLGRQDGRPEATRDPCCHGGAIRHSARSADGHHRPAKHGDADNRQPD